MGRYYDPATGQFLNVDPLVDATGQTYVYTGDDPVNGVDPSGLSWYDPSWASPALDSVGSGLTSLGECLGSLSCLSPEGLANAGAGFADQAAQLVDSLICNGTSQLTCPTWSVGAPFPCGPQGSYQAGETEFFITSLFVGGMSGDLADGTNAISAAEGAGIGSQDATSLAFSQKILSQLASRGWTQGSVEDTYAQPFATHDVWDFTSGGKEPATAYVQPGGGYVVVNDDSGQVVQVSDLNNPNWKPVWNDPRFQR